MNILKTLNLLVRFLLELCMLAAVGYWGSKTQSGAIRTILGIGLPILMIVIWALLVAPKASHRLQGTSHMLLSLILLGSGAVALYASGQKAPGWIYLILLIVNQVLLIVWKQQY